MSNSCLILKNPCRLCGFSKFDSKIDAAFFVCLSCGSTAPRNFNSVKYTYEGEDSEMFDSYEDDPELGEEAIGYW